MRELVINEIENLDLGATGELPMGQICLPGLIRQRRLESNPGALGALLWLGLYKATAFEHTVIVDTAGTVPWRFLK